MKNLITVILAAGKGTRMNSKDIKVIQNLMGLPVVEHVIELAEKVNSKKTICVIGHDSEKVKDVLSHKNVEYVIQAEQLGTGHAVKCAVEYLSGKEVLILTGDAPLFREETIKKLIEDHYKKKKIASLLTSKCINPSGYGRIVRDENNNFVEIVEHKDADENQLLINEINSGVGIVNGDVLIEELDKLKSDNSQNEYYLTDVFSNLSKDVGLTVCEDFDETLGINDRKQLAYAQKILLERKIDELYDAGVTIMNPATIYIEKKVKVGRDTIIYSGVNLRGNTVIGEDCIIDVNSNITDSIIADNVVINNSTIVESSVDSGSKIGPYAYLRPKSRVGKDTKIGDFVEIKNAKIGDGTKISHLSYVGDGEVGQNCNIGCGVVFVNYDGSSKSLTKLGDDVFVGCNSNLVAPVELENGAYVAAGSTITEDVPKNSLAIARARQTIKENWKNKFLVKK